MWDVIVAGTRHITQAAASCGARLVHISSDVIFNGREAPYAESAEPAPLHAYGRAKAEAEKIAAAYANHAIVRTSLIYGLRLMDRGTAWMVEALRAGEPVTLFTDQIRNPVWAQQLEPGLPGAGGQPFLRHHQCRRPAENQPRRIRLAHVRLVGHRGAGHAGDGESDAGSLAGRLQP